MIQRDSRRQSGWRSTSLRGFTGGIGYNLGKILLDAYVEYASNEIKTTSFDDYDDSNNNNFDIITAMSKFGLSVKLSI